jgi:hypothetical protein
MNQITAATAPLVETFANAMKETIISVTQWFQSIRPSLSQFYNTISAVVTGTKEMIFSLVGGIFNALGEIGKSLGFSGGQWEDWGTWIKKTLIDVEFFFKRWKDIWISMQDELAIKLAELFSNPQTVKTLKDDYQKRIDQLGKDLAEFRKQRDAIKPLPAPQLAKQQGPGLADMAAQVAKPPAAIDRGTEQAFSAIQQYNREQTANQIQLLQQQVQIAQRAAGLLGQIAGAVGNGIPLVPAPLF